MINVYKNVFWYFKQQKVAYIMMMILLLVISFLSTLTPKVVGMVIDSITQGSLTIQSLILLGGLLLLIPIALYILNYLFHKTINMKGQLLSRQLRILYLGKLFSQDSKIFEEYNKGELISRISNDMPSITQAATMLLSDLVYCASLMLFVLIFMIFTVSLKLTLIAFSIVPLTFFFLNIARQNMRKYYKIHRKIFSAFFDSILESIEGTKVVRAYTQEDEDIQKNVNAITLDINSWKKIVKFEVIFGPLFEAVIAISTFLTFSYGSYLVIIGDITVGQLITFSAYITMIAGPIMVLANIFNVVNQANVSSERFFEVMERESEVVDKAESQDVYELNTLEFKDVSFKYPFDDYPTIKNINLTINKGETIGIVGPTGSGKSTLIRQLLREFKTTSGVVLINGQSIEEYKIQAVRELVGYVPQVHVLFQGSVEDNLMIGLPNANEETKHSAIEIAAFENDLAYMQDGINTYVGESGTGLSGGQKQRLSIARAIIKEPQILILDDSLSAVDAKTEKSIINNLKDHRQDKTNIIISHRFSVIKEANKIIVLQNGEITESGSHYELMQNGGWYAVQYENQVKGL
ncbi:MAG: ABC transporter ATP-binding protein [Mycoplasmatales bacterium]